ncbi:MAG TPA: leucine-rich repeat domain-containing protein [Candidatus Acidoferrum sp.]|nr:leucine-rich repeat domain-containing protein [Candidatus Acidoferrum sp.]
MKNMKVVRVIGLMAALLAAPAAAQGQYGYSTNADGSTATITNYAGPGGDVIIPPTISNLTVTIIGANAFFEFASLTSVTIPSSVTSIGSSAFYSCTSLTNVSLPDGLTSIGDTSFLNCSSLTNVAIPRSVTNLGWGAFYATALAGITIPGSVSDIGPNAFFHCLHLTHATIENGVTSIEGEAFGQTALTNITIPASVTNIGDAAFAWNDLEPNTYLTSVTILGGVTSFGQGVFWYCVSLTNATISNGVTSIGPIAFASCSNLASVTIPGSVTSIGSAAFSDCTSLTKVYFAGNAPSADSTVFAGENPTAYYLPGTTGWSGFSASNGLPVVLWNPLVQASGPSFGVRGKRFGFNITGTPNIPIVVQAADSLANPVWTSLQSLTLTNGSCYFSEPFQPGCSQHYYRISPQ